MEPICLFPGCGRTTRTMGLCATHYAQKNRGKGLTPIRTHANAHTETECSFEGCSLTVESRGLCPTHYRQQLRGRPLSTFTSPMSREGGCSREDCDFLIASRGLCSAHYQQDRRRIRREQQAVTREA